MILDGCSFFVSTGETSERSSSLEVSKVVLALGGEVHTKFVVGETTHLIISAHSTTSRAAVLAASADELPILDPSWIFDCQRLNKRLNESGKYVHPPEVIARITAKTAAPPSPVLMSKKSINVENQSNCRTGLAGSNTTKEGDKAAVR